MLPILGVIGLIVGIIFVAQGCKCYGWLESILYGIGILMIMFGIFMVVLTPAMYFDSVATIADMKSYSEYGKYNHIETIQATGNAVIRTTGNNISINVPVDNLNQSTNWSERILEFRDETKIYNQRLQRLRDYNENIWLFAMFANPPETLKLLYMSGM